MEYIKQAQKSEAGTGADIEKAVQSMLADITLRGEPAVRDYAKKFDDWQGEFVLTNAKRKTLIEQVSTQDKADIDFAYRQIKTFAEAQLASIQAFEIETEPGVKLGQKIVPINCAGCYVPGGRLCARCLGLNEHHNCKSGRRQNNCGLLSTQRRTNPPSHCLRYGLSRC